MWCVTGAAASARAFSEALAAIRALTGRRRPSAWKRAGAASDPPGRSVAHPARSPRTRQARCARDPHRAGAAGRLNPWCFAAAALDSGGGSALGAASDKQRPGRGRGLGAGASIGWPRREAR